MTIKTEGRHAGEFIVSEAEGTRSRDVVTVKSGENLVAGQVVQDDGSGNMIAADGALNTAGDALVTAVAGIMFDNVDASGGAVDNAVMIARDAEVNDEELTYPNETTAGGEKAATQASLKALGIITR